MTRVKICGVTTPADAAAVSVLGADAIGLNFIPASPRRLDLAATLAICDELPSTITTVALVQAHPLLIADILRQFTPDIFQIYNWSEDEFIRDKRRYCPFRIRNQSDLDHANRFLNDQRDAGIASPEAVILDSHSDNALGGTGHTAPWHLLAGFDPGVPVILAGGLTPDNVAEAIRIVKPWGVDVASGVEKSPGVKDLIKVRDFIQVVRAVG